MFNTEEYLWNMGDIVYDMAEQHGEVECLDDYVTNGATLIVGIKTLTEEYDPSVNYYYDGMNSIESFIPMVKERLQAKSVTFVSDVDVGGDDEGWDCWIVKHGDLVIEL